MDGKSNSSFTIISRPLPKWVVDRFEEGWAVLDNSDTFESISLPTDGLPAGIKPGDTLVKQNGKWYKDKTDSADRKKRISERFARIKNMNK